MAKITRNSYKRKIIMFGIMLFVSIALISTGFAAWVLSTQAKKDGNGNVTVGSVTDASFEITFDKITDQYGTVITNADELKFSFEPTKEDDEGRVRWDGTNCENLVLTFEGTVTNYQYLGTFNVKMTISDEIQKLVTDGYITLPSCATTDGKYIYSTAPGASVESGEGIKFTDQEDGTAKFTYKIAFGWGEKFSGVNPSLYYDAAGATVEDAVVKTTLEAFYALMDTTKEDYNKFTITFTAKAK